MKKQLNIELPVSYLDPTTILGPKDCLINLIKNDTSAKVGVYNNSSISIYGEESEVHRIEKIIERMIQIASQHEPLTKNEVGILLNQSKENEEFFVPRDRSVILQYGKHKIVTKTKGQQEYLDSMRKNDITICIGAPGTSKTFSAVCYGLSLLLEKEIDKIIITRPMVEAKGERSLGSLPGEINSKLGIYLIPMIDVFERILGKSVLDEYINKGKIQMLPIGYMRGLSLYRTFCLCDEAQNLTVTLAKLLATRLGEQSKIVVCGDPIQKDLTESISGLDYLANSLNNEEGIGVVRLNNQDIVRHPLITKILNCFEKYDSYQRELRLSPNFHC